MPGTATVAKAYFALADQIRCLSKRHLKYASEHMLGRMQTRWVHAVHPMRPVLHLAQQQHRPQRPKAQALALLLRHVLKITASSQQVTCALSSF